MVARAAVARPRRRDDGRRRERRARAEGRRHRCRDGQRRAGDAGGRAARAARRQLRDAAGCRRRGPPGHRQHRAGRQPVPHQDGLRDAARARGRVRRAGRTRSCPATSRSSARLTIGIPAFFLALAPNTRRYVPGFVQRVLRFAIPCGHRRGGGDVPSYAVARRFDGVTLDEARTTATLVLLVVGLWVLDILARPITPFRGALFASMVGHLPADPRVARRRASSTRWRSRPRPRSSRVCASPAWPWRCSRSRGRSRSTISPGRSARGGSHGGRPAARPGGRATASPDA